MTRSKDKLVYVHRSLFPKFFHNQKKKILRKKLYKFINEKGVKIGPSYFFWNRITTLSNRLVNKRFALYNGFLFHVLKTNINHLGYRLGDFTVTRRTAIHPAKKQRQIKKRDKIKNKKNFFENKYSATSFLKQIKKKEKKSNRQKAREEKREKR